MDTINSNNSCCNNSSNNYYCNNSNNNFETIFYKVFKNKVIRKNILYFCFLYKINRKIAFYSLEGLLNYPEYSYISSLEINWDYFLKFNGYHFLPSNVQTIIFNAPCYTKLTAKEMLPSTITAIDFKYTSFSFEEGFLPSSIKYLKLGLPFSQIILPGSFPDSITSIELYSFKLDHPLNFLPKKLKYLILSDSFNGPLGAVDKAINDINNNNNNNNDNNSYNQNDDNSNSNNNSLCFFPPTLETLIFGSSFNQDISLLSNLKSLKRLKFGDKFNQPINSLVNLPLLQLSFGQNFNQTIKDKLPPTLTSLHLGYAINFKQTIDRQSIPLSVKSLTIIENNTAKSDSTGLTTVNNFIQKSIPINQLNSNTNSSKDYFKLLKKQWYT